MLGLRLPQPMAHALPRECSFDFYSPSRSVAFDAGRQMQLPPPRPTAPHELDAFRTGPRPPLTPPASAAVRNSHISARERPRSEYSYQLPAIADSRPVPASRSPTPQRQSQQQQPQDTSMQSRKWSISPNLRIPNTIKTPQESLPQLAAEVTCLFWFESSSTLKQVLDVNSPYPTKPLVPDARPTTGFRKWVTTILTTTQVAQNVILLALLFIHRLKDTNPTVKGKPGSEYRLLTVALMLGNKFLDDNTYTNKTWAEVTGISVQEVHIMEVEFLSNMRYSLFTSEEQWKDWHILLGKFGTFYDRASRIPPLSAISPTGLSKPSLQLPTQYLPSQPVQMISPPNTVSYSPPRSQYSHTPWLQPQPTSSAVSPIGPLPELGPLTQRKRSADSIDEPAPKRIAHGMAPGPYSNAPLIPTLQMPVSRAVEHRPSGPRLPLPPLPNLSIPTPSQNPPIQVNPWSDVSLPAPGTRSMAMVYPPQWNQLTTPTSTAHSFSTSHTPTAGDQSRHVSPYPMSAGSSPVSASFSSVGQRQLSPSYFLNQRQSPYRPVRGVQTLLVPPPSTAIHNAPQNIRYDQMQYQPLGRPMTERRAGPLPYMDQRAWPEMHHSHQIHQPPVQLPALQPQLFHR